MHATDLIGSRPLKRRLQLWSNRIKLPNHSPDRCSSARYSHCATKSTSSEASSLPHSPMTWLAAYVPGSSTWLEKSRRPKTCLGVSLSPVEETLTRWRPKSSRLGDLLEREEKGIESRHRMMELIADVDELAWNPILHPTTQNPKTMVSKT